MVFVGPIKEWCVLSFVKGVLLKDSNGLILEEPARTRSRSVVRFTGVRQIVALEPVLKAYIDEAIAVEKAGLKVKLKKISELKVPEELQTKFDEMSALKKAFTA